MTNLEHLLTLLIAENQSDIAIPSSLGEQRQLLRALMNVRPPLPVGEEMLRLQDEELARQREEKGVVSLTGEGLMLWQGDITRLRVDAIVNAANSQMLGCFRPLHSCIDNAIHSAAGLLLRNACYEQMRIKTNNIADTADVIVTEGFNLPSRYVMHVVGPIIPDGHPTPEQEEQLADCYRNCLLEAAHLGLESIAFCCISTGVFRFPQQRAAEIAVATVRECNIVKQVIFNVFKDEDKRIYQTLLS